MALCLLLALLAGCAGVERQQPATAGWQAHSKQLTALQQWTASGKLAVRTSEMSESAGLVWQQDAQQTHLQLSGPLGMGATTIDSDGTRLDIRQGEDFKSLDISTPDAIRLNTGWDLPLSSLIHWLKGLPAPQQEIQKLELEPQTELLQTLQQDQWEVRYEQYGQFGDLTLPTRLQIQRGTTRVKVMISQWQTP
jgi:outer membrane lipoprotein LolB